MGDFLCNRVNEAELRMVEIEYMIDQKEEEHQLDKLTGYARRIHCGLILNGGFVEDDEVASWQRPGYDMISETNAAN